MLSLRVLRDLGVPVLTADKTKMIAAYSANLLKMSNIDGGFNEEKIATGTDKQYYLIFKGTSYKSTLLLVADKSDLYAVGTTSCTTSDCLSEEWGCTPSASGMACTPCANQGKCTKTVTSFSMIE